MPLNKRCTSAAFGENIGIELKAGKPRKQAVAIAYSTLRKACGVKKGTRAISASEILSKGRRGLL